jgi:protocatechuate 3,4-dioxygenase beta subunit
MPTDQQGTARISGRVVAADTGAPLRGARVSVWGGDTQSGSETVTDADGRYAVGQLTAGAFYVNASHEGYLTTFHGRRRHRMMERGAAVRLAAGQSVEDVDLALPREGVIVVTLTDDLDRPLAGATVQIRQLQYRANGERRLTDVPTGHRRRGGVPTGTWRPDGTDDRGEFRATGLMPGDYVIRASVHTIRRGDARVQGDAATGLSPTYYPGTAHADDAKAVTLGMSEERAVRFAMVAARLSRLTGAVTMSNGQPAAGMDLQLAEDGGGMVYGAGTVAEDGTFAISGVPAGRYTLQIRQGARPRFEDIRRMQESGVPHARVRGEFVSIPLMVSGEDVTGLQIVTGRGTTITGHVVFEGASPRPSTSELRVFALPPRLAGGGWFVIGSSVYDFPPESGVGADGGFRIEGASGRVQLDLQAPGWTVKSVTLDGRDVTDEALDLAGIDTVSGVAITLTDRIASVAGHVRESSGQPVLDYVVVLLAGDSSGTAATPRRAWTTHADDDGRFQISGVRPGRYLAAALDGFEWGRESAPEFQQQMRPLAIELTVGEGETVTLELTLTPDLG